MLPSERQRKRMIVLSVLLSAFLVLVVAWYLVVKPAPTCSDGTRNQDETDVDCGGACPSCEERLDPEALVVKEVVFVPSGIPDHVDLFAKIYNPNDALGAPALPYAFSVLDAEGEVVGEAAGKTFILPQETKTVLSVNVNVSGVPSSIELSLDKASWERFSGYQEKPTLSITERRYERISSGPFFSEVSGKLTNESVFDFRAIGVKVVLRDPSGNVVAMNQTEMNTVLSKETREFRLRFPNAFPGEVSRIDVETEADIYHDENFVERARESGKFQELQ